MTEVKDSLLLVAREMRRPWMQVRQLALSQEGVLGADAVARDEMVAVSERAMRQVEDLLRMERLEMYEDEPVVVRKVCETVAERMDKVFRKNRRDFEVEYTNRTRLVMANAELLAAVVYNFLLNAVQYTAEGEKAVLTVSERAQRVRVAVRDFGPALPMEFWREFERGLVREPEAIAMRPGSSGLSLVIVNEFARQMHAKVGAVRHRDGASFYVELEKVLPVSLFDEVGLLDGARRG